MSLAGLLRWRKVDPAPEAFLPDLPEDTRSAIARFIRDLADWANRNHKAKDKAMRWGSTVAHAYVCQAGLLQILVVSTGRLSRDEKLPDLRRQQQLRKRLLNDPAAMSADDRAELGAAGITLHGDEAGV